MKAHIFFSAGKLAKAIVILSFIFFIFLIYSYNSNSYAFTTPDEVVLKSFGEIYFETGKLYYGLGDELIGEYTRKRGTEVFYDKIIPTKFIGFPIYFGLLSGFGVYQYATAITSVATLLVLFFIFRDLIGSDRKAFIPVGLLIFLPFFWYWSNYAFVENVSSIFFFSLGFYLFLVSLKEEKHIAGQHRLSADLCCSADSKPTNKNQRIKLAYYDDLMLLLAFAFFGISISIRYDLIILLISIFIPNFKKLFRLKWKKLILCGIVFLLFLSPSLISSKELYGGYFSYGENFIREKYDVQDNRSFQNVYSYFKQSFLFLPLFYLATFLGLIIFLEKKLKKNTKFFVYSYVIYFVLFSLLIILNNPLKHPNILHESYTRYFLWFYISSVFFCSYFILHQINYKLKILLIFALVFLSVLSVTPILESKYSVMDSSEKINLRLLSLEYEFDYLLVGQSDKFLSKDLKTISVEHFVDKNREINYSKFGDFISNFSADNSLAVYVAGLNIKAISDELSRKGLYLEELDKDLGLYRIKQK